MKATHLRGAVLAAILVAVGLAGCQVDRSDDLSSPTSGSDQSAPTAAAFSDSGLTDPVGVSQDLTKGECSVDPGEVTATGSVVNSASDPADIVVSVSWTADGSAVVARANETLKQVAPGASQEYKITTTANPPAGQSLRCVVSAESGTLKG